MKTRTTIETPTSAINFSHEDHILTLGSCFADRVGLKLHSLKYGGISNPFGIFYNPISILKSLQATVSGEAPEAAHFCLLDGVQLNYDYHSDMVASSKEDYLHLISENQTIFLDHLSQSQIIIITLGSAYVYEFSETVQIIANCHKQNPNKFNRRLLTYDECKSSLAQLVDLIHSINDSIKIILTVSPIRHIRDTIVGNSKSKATLINAVHHIVDQYEACSYFPAYEIMIDDLRDYRYYEDDMLHPSGKAFDYIWELFEEAYIHPDSQRLNKRIEKILKSVQHRPIRRDSPSHQAFVEDTLEKIRGIQNEVVDADWIDEIRLLKSLDSLSD